MIIIESIRMHLKAMKLDSFLKSENSIDKKRKRIELMINATMKRLENIIKVMKLDIFLKSRKIINKNRIRIRLMIEASLSRSECI